MSETMQRTLLIIAAIAVYEKHGVIKAVNYLRDNGFTTTEAIDIIARFDDYRDQVKKGLLPERQ
jgi:hypothetical protein